METATSTKDGLRVESLTKRYRRIPAVEDVSFTAQPGEILGYLGPNGSGKSTTVKILVGLLEPSAGHIFYQGRDLAEHREWFQQKLGYVPEEPHLYSHLTGREYLDLTGRLRGMPPRALRERTDRMLELFGLTEARHTPTGSYSKGMRQRVLLAAALLDDPEVIILDEPFSGLDAASVLVFRELLALLARAGKVILYSSHDMEIVERVCARVLILYKGKAVAYDSVSRLRELLSKPSLEAVFTDLTMRTSPTAQAAYILEAMRA